VSICQRQSALPAGSDSERPYRGHNRDGTLRTITDAPQDHQRILDQRTRKVITTFSSHRQNPDAVDNCPNQGGNRIRANAARVRGRPECPCGREGRNGA
jgi:hypothetical protein